MRIVFGTRLKKEGRFPIMDRARIIYCSDRTIDGSEVERNRYEHPYSYTRFCIYKNGWKPTDRVVWSDRLEGEPGSSDKLREEYLGVGSYYSGKSPKDIERFLSRLFEYEVVLTGIEQECNASNGFPYWLLYFRKK